GSKLLLPGALGQLGRALLLSGSARAAIPYLERALSLSSEIGQVENAAIWASNLASVYIDLEDWDRAEASNRESIRLRKKASIPLLFFNEINSGEIAAGRGDRVQAEHHFVSAMRSTMKDGKGNPIALWDAEWGLGKLARSKRNLAEAARHFEAGVAA